MRHFTLLTVAGLFLLGGVPAAYHGLQPSQAKASVTKVAAVVAVAPERRAAAAPLRPALDPVVDQPGWANDQWSILAVSIDRGDVLYSRSPDQKLATASTLKLFTTAAALYYLGPDFRFSTHLLTDGRIENGVLVGNVYLYGTGDPTLGKRFAPRPAEVLTAFADTLAALGVREIRGDIIGDGSYFSGPRTGHGWQPDYLNSWYATPAGALSVHENLVRLEITPGEKAGYRPAVKYTPGGEGIAVVNRAVTGGGRRIAVSRADYDGPIVIEGRIGGGKVSSAVTVADPERYAAAVFRDVAREKGIAHTGSVGIILDPAASPVTGKANSASDDGSDRPPVRVLAVHASEPLREILKVINHQSHNFYAEQVLRAVGKMAVGDGSIAGGGRAIKILLARAGADTTGVVLADGCGLSPENRVSARAFTRLLAFMADSPFGREYENTLSVAGKVRRFRRMGGTPAEGNLRAKTGTIDHVSGLAGYVTSQGGERIAFAILSNHVPSVAQAKFIENRIGAELAGYTRGGRPVAVSPETEKPPKRAQAAAAKSPTPGKDRARRAARASGRRASR